LEDHGNVALGGCNAEYAFACDPQVAVAGVFSARDDVEQRRFSAAVHLQVSISVIIELETRDVLLSHRQFLTVLH
jgi:hypothetical protein